jgi:hypothetical protein
MKRLNKSVTLDTAVLPRAIHFKAILKNAPRDLCIRICISALFMIGKVIGENEQEMYYDVFIG